MATIQEIKEAQAHYPGRYTFDRETGVCVKIESRSLAERYPLYGSDKHLHNHVDAGYNGVVNLDSCKACQAEHNRGERWRAYLRRELSV